MIRPIAKIPDPILRKKGKPGAQIPDEIHALVADMKDTMYDEPGCGIAAPQIGVSLRVIAWDSPENEDGFQVLVNPSIVKKEGSQKGPEGCLSVPGVTGEVVRATAIQVEGMDMDGQRVSLSLTDFTARILQHETDHVDGLLYIDRMSLAERSLLEKKLKKLRDAAPLL